MLSSFLLSNNLFNFSCVVYSAVFPARMVASNDLLDGRPAPTASGSVGECPEFEALIDPFKLIILSAGELGEMGEVC